MIIHLFLMGGMSNLLSANDSTNKDLFERVLTVIQMDNFHETSLQSFGLVKGTKSVESMFYSDSGLGSRIQGGSYYVGDKYLKRHFDRQGNLTDEYLLTPDSLKTKAHEIYTYSNGRLVSVNYVSRSRHYPRSRKWDNLFVKYEYQESELSTTYLGRVKKDTVIYEWFRFTGDSVANKVDEVQTYQNQRFSKDSQRFITWVYDSTRQELKRTIDRMEAFSDHRVVDSLKYQFHRNGKVKSVHHYENGIVDLVKEYNDSGRLTSSINPIYSLHKFIDYNENGLIVLEESGTLKVKYTYLEFDVRGNWELREISQTDNGENVVVYEKRIITYFQ